MALILLAGVAYASYKKRQQALDLQLEEESSEILDLLEDKTPVRLLPDERSLAVFESPISTVTYYDGDYMIAAKHLCTRINEIVEKNPWIGGWVSRPPRKKGEDVDKEIKLWYDETGQQVAPGTFRVFAPGEVPLMSDTPYEEYQQLSEEFFEKGGSDQDKAKVPNTSDLLGKNRAAWRVSLIPVTDMPDSKFVMVVSMSRVLGDPATFFHLYSMLSMDAEVYALNPQRRLEVTDIVTKEVGKDEIDYIKNATKDSKWTWTQKDKKDATKNDPIKVLIFAVSKEWLSAYPGKKQNCSDAAVAASWFFKTLQPTVGMLSFDYRDKLPNSRVTETDAGNYVVTFPLTEADYDTPDLVQKSLENHQRCGQDPPVCLPQFSWDMTFAFANDWGQYHSQSLNLGAGVQETLHLPLYDARDLVTVPNKLSLEITFRAGPETENESGLGVFVVAPESACQEIEGSGAVGKMIAAF